MIRNEYNVQVNTVKAGMALQNSSGTLPAIVMEIKKILKQDFEKLQLHLNWSKLVSKYFS